MSCDATKVIDVPEHLTPDEAAQLLNAPGEAYFLVQVLPVPGGHRAYLRRYKQTQPTRAEAAKENAGKTDEATALSILRANRDEPVRTIVDLLGKAGIKRGRQWVCDKLEETCAEDGREAEAVAFVKKHCSPDWEPKDVSGDLRYATKIKRSAKWARRQLDELRAAVRADNS